MIAESGFLQDKPITAWGTARYGLGVVDHLLRACSSGGWTRVYKRPFVASTSTSNIKFNFCRRARAWLHMDGPGCSYEIESNVIQCTILNDQEGRDDLRCFVCAGWFESRELTLRGHWPMFTSSFKLGRGSFTRTLEASKLRWQLQLF